MDVGDEGNVILDVKNVDGVVEGMYLKNLVAASSSCSTLSGSLRFVETSEVNQEDAANASILETPSETGTMIVINAVLDQLKDAQKQRALNPSPEESLVVKEECNKSPLSSGNTQDDKQDVSDTPPDDALLEAGSTHIAVNAVLKRLITGFWMENNEKTSQDETTQVEEEASESLGTDKIVEEKPDKVELSTSHALEETEAENHSSDEVSITSKEFIHSVKSINDDLQDKVKSFASFVFGTREEKADMFKSNEIKVQTAGDNHDEEGDSFRHPDQDVPVTCDEQQKISKEGDAASNGSDKDEHEFTRVESELFDEDMSADEIFATLNKIEAVTKNILDLPVFSVNNGCSADMEEEVLSREDEETGYRENDVTSCREEAIGCSTVDPPSVCSRNSRRDPPNLTTNTYEPLDENLLLMRKDNVTTSDTRDPPATTTDKFLSKLEFSFSETLPSAGVERLPRDPSEHGGSLELDSFSHDDEPGNASVTYYESASKAAAKGGQKEIVNQGLSAGNEGVALFFEPAKRDQLHAIMGKEPTSNDNKQNIPSIANCDLPAHNDIPNTNRTPAEPVGTSFPIDSRIVCRKTQDHRHLKEPEESNHMQCQKREPVKSKSGSPEMKVQVDSKQVKDLYQRPDFVSNIINEPESSRDAMVRQRLIQLNSRYLKLTSQSQTESDQVEFPLKSAHPMLKSARSCASQSQLSTSVELSKSNAQHTFREQQFTFDNLDTTTVSTPSLSIKGTDSGLSPSAAARHEHYKKQLFSVEKNGLRSLGSNDTSTCLSPSAAQRRLHYKEVLREQMAKQRHQVASKE